MGLRENYVVAADAAAQLGVNQQRVRALLARGDLRGERVGGTWLVDPSSLADHQHARQPAAGRPLAPVTAWAALLTMFGTELDAETVEAFRFDGNRRRRVRALANRDVDDWRWLARRRANVRRYSTRPAYLERLRSQPGVTLAGTCSEHADIIAEVTDHVDVYADEPTCRRLVDRYRLRPDGAGNVTLRTIALEHPEQLSVIQNHLLPELVVAVDLCEQRDPRTAAAGRQTIAAISRRARTAREF